jgi:hypothetical protein
MNRMTDQSRKETRLAAIKYFILKPVGFLHWLEISFVSWAQSG